jgi:RecB family exonuclease
MTVSIRSKSPKPLLQAWSYSVYKAYQECPQRVYFSHVLKIRMPEKIGPPLIKGDMIHKAAEIYVGTAERSPKLTAPLAEAEAHLEALAMAPLDLAAERRGLKTALANLVKMKPDLDRLRKAKARTEVKWAFDKDYKPVPYFDKSVWLRIQADVYFEEYEPKPLLPIIDYKTGKVYPEHRQQRSLYALGALVLVDLGALMAKLPKPRCKDLEVTAEHWYTDIGFKDRETFGIASLKPLTREWAARTREMLIDTVYKPRPSARACRFCQYHARNHGPCKEGV